MYNRWDRLLTTLNQPGLSPINLQQFANVVHEKGAALENCWGFVDGTVEQVCRPGLMQRILYDGHKRVHAIKYQSVSAPNGLCANLRGPYEGKLHDASSGNQDFPAFYSCIPILSYDFTNRHFIFLLIPLLFSGYPFCYENSIKIIFSYDFLI